MGIFSFLKKKKKEPKEETKKRLNFSEVEDWVNEKIKDNNEKEKQALIIANKKTRELYPNLEEKIERLRSVDIKNKKASEREKTIVNQGKNSYIESLEKLLIELNNLDNKRLQDYINKINELFSSFYKKTNISFQKANYLIGKELNEITSILKEFSNSLMNILNENKQIIEETKKLEEIKNEVQKTEEYEREIKKINSDIEETKKKIYQNNDERKKISNKVKEIKNSKEYQSNIKNKRIYENLKKEISLLINQLKNSIDFKKLSNFMHIFPEKIKTIKEYKENFSERFKEDKEKIIDLIEEANLKNSEIDNKLKKIHEKEKLMQETCKKIQEDKVEKTSNDIEKIDSEVDTLEKRKMSEEKRKNRLESEKSNLKNSIKVKIGKLGIITFS